MSFARKGLFLSLTTYVVLALGLVHVYVLSRALGPDGVGQMTLFRQTFVMAAQLALLGLPMSMINRLRREVAEPAVGLYSVSIVCGVLSLVSTSVVVALLVATKGRVYSNINGMILVSACIWVPTLMQRAVLYSFLLSKQNVRALALLDLCPPLILACYYVISWNFFTLDVTTAVIAEAVTVGLINLILAVRLVKPWRVLAQRKGGKLFDRSLVREMLPDGLMMCSTSVLILLLGFVSLLILRVMVDDAEVGIYSRGLRLATILALGVQSVQRLFYANWSGMEPKRRAQSVERTINLSITVALLGGAVLLLLTRPIVLLLFGSEFLQAVSVTRITFGGVLFFVIIRTLQSLYNADSRPYLSMLVFGVGLLSSVILLMVLVPTYEADGAAWAYLLAQLLMAAVSLWIAVSRYKLRLTRMLIPDPRLLRTLFQIVLSRKQKKA